MSDPLSPDEQRELARLLERARAQKQADEDSMPPLVSIIATRTRMVELLLAVCVLGLTLVIGLLTVVALQLARSGGGVDSGYLWVPSAALAAGLLLGVLGTLRGRRRGTVMMPWALAGAALWLLPTVWALMQVSR